MRIVRSYDYECGSKVKIHIASLSIATHAAATRLARSPPFEKSISALAKIDEATATESALHSAAAAAALGMHAASRRRLAARMKESVFIVSKSTSNAFRRRGARAAPTCLQCS